MKSHRIKRAAAFLLAALLLIPAIPISHAADDTEFTASDGLLAMIKRYEDYLPEKHLAGGVWYIGYSSSCGEDDYPDGITEEEATELICLHLKKSASALDSFLEERKIELTQRQYDALLDFCYNMGTNWLSQKCKLRTALINGTIFEMTESETVNLFGVWCHVSGKVSSALAHRRIEEALMFNHDSYLVDASSYVYLNMDINGGASDSDIFFYRKGKPYLQFPGVKRSRYTLVGWQTKSETMLSELDIASKDISVTAVWTPYVEETPYADVDKYSWFAPYVIELSKRHIVSGYPDGSFRPAENVTVGAALKLILLAAGYEEQPALSGQHWASGYLALAESSGFIEKGYALKLDTPASRLLIAQITAAALSLEAEGSSPFDDTRITEVTALYEVGIAEGSIVNGKRLYKPESSIIRSEMCAIVSRIRKYTAVYPSAADGGYVMEEKKIETDTDGRLSYNDSSVRTITGIDVSHHQGEIDWEAVAADGIEFAMLRIGYRGHGTEGTLNPDTTFEANYEAARAAGIKVGVYFFSQAITPEEAYEEAMYTLELLDGRELDYPIAYDWELPGKTARTYGLANEIIDECSKVFLAAIEEAGYIPMLYFNRSMYFDIYNLDEYKSGNSLWFALYDSTSPIEEPLNIWQYTPSGTVAGIKGDVDLNISIEKYRK